jgi:methyltransferase
MIFILFISFIALSRIGELMLSKRNEKWLVQHNAVEFGKEHYQFMVMLHVLFFVSLIVEYIVRAAPHYSLFFIVLPVILLLIKAWIITSLGKFWTTKIYRIPGSWLINKGPYKYVKHPNYMIVIAEIAVIPLAFHLYYTAVVFTILNALMLYVRIKEENKALQI